MRTVNPPDGARLSGVLSLGWWLIACVCVSVSECLCMGMAPITPNELFTDYAQRRSFATAKVPVKLIECHHKFNLNISNLRKILTTAFDARDLQIIRYSFFRCDSWYTLLFETCSHSFPPHEIVPLWK